jgi:hypothetical protein
MLKSFWNVCFHVDNFSDTESLERELKIVFELDEDAEKNGDLDMFGIRENEISEMELHLEIMMETLQIEADEDVIDS